MSTKSLIYKSLAVISKQIERYDTQESLDPFELKALNEIVRTLVQVDRNERQTELEQDLSRLKDEDMKALAERAIKYLKEPESNE